MSRKPSRHPGVVILRRVLPSGRETFQARWTDPDSGALKKPILDLQLYPTDRARRLWAQRKSVELLNRRRELAAGAPVRTHTTVPIAMQRYLNVAAVKLRPSTLATYRSQGLDWFVQWAAKTGLQHVEDLSRARLADLYAATLAARRLHVVKGRKRGTRAPMEAGRRASSTNTLLKNLRALLNFWERSGLLPLLTKQAISDGLRPLDETRDAPAYLQTEQLRKLLSAACEHDREPGRAPIAAYTAALLLSGMRRGEALGLRWSDVDLEALDQHGAVVGEVRLRGEHTKTKRGRTIGLDVSPLLFSLFVRLRARAGDLTPDARVFDWLTVDSIESARARLGDLGAPAGFQWKHLRSTCACFLTNAPGLFGAASVFMSARQLGHAVQVAETRYLNVIRGIPRDARSLEQAMLVEEPLRQLISIMAGALSVAVSPKTSSR